MEIKIPKLSLVVLIGASGSGKSTFARNHFKATEVLSSDYCRALVSDDENDQNVTKEAFEILHFIASKRLAAGKLTVIDATNVQPEARKPLVQLAREYHALPVAIVFDMNDRLCEARNKIRPDRNFGGHVLRQQMTQLRRSIRNLKREGFRHIFKLTSEDEVNESTVERVSLWNDKTDLNGPFDIIGDIHGCYDELVDLIRELGYVVDAVHDEAGMEGPVYKHPEGRLAVFLGDFVDRGPRIVDTIRLVRNMVKEGYALCVPGNHDIKLMRKLNGKDVQIVHGLAESMLEIESLPFDIQKTFRDEVAKFIDGLVSHYVLDKGYLVVAHAGLKQEMQGRGSGKVREFCLFGETTGETDEFGLPVRHNWAADYRGRSIVVYGHTPVPDAEWLNRTINIDTGCVFGGKLTALRYPEKELISIDARHTYCIPAKPFLHENEIRTGMSIQQEFDDLLDAEDVLGKRFITTRLRSAVTVREENATAALEVMSRFAVNPKWLIYLPPTMSPSETSQRTGYLEYPDEAFAYFRANGVPKVICEQKHMGSRAIVVICKDEQAALKRFGVQDEGTGIIYTRTGRRFFSNPKIETAFLQRIHNALDVSGFWGEFNTDWACLDCELMPWSEKAQELLRTQYAAAGAAATVSLADSIRLLKKTASRTDLDRDFELPPESSAREFKVDQLVKEFEGRAKNIESYIKAYRKYCWPVNSIDDLKLAPFHLLATEGQVFFDKDHAGHMNALAKICSADSGILLLTPHMIVDVTSEESINEASSWWESLTEKGEEGMVVKPLSFIAKGKKGLIQPALKCRGREYLRIIYGAEYTSEHNIERLRSRALGTKRSLALREFALGVEAMERFIRNEPLRRVHECVFGILALESEPVDPRL